jgi:hypothetical protein
MDDDTFLDAIVDATDGKTDSTDDSIFGAALDNLFAYVHGGAPIVDTPEPVLVDTLPHIDVDDDDDDDDDDHDDDHDHDDVSTVDCNSPMSLSRSVRSYSPVSSFDSDVDENNSRPPIPKLILAKVKQAEQQYPLDLSIQIDREQGIEPVQSGSHAPDYGPRFFVAKRARSSSSDADDLHDASYINNPNRGKGKAKRVKITPEQQPTSYIDLTVVEPQEGGLGEEDIEIDDDDDDDYDDVDDQGQILVDPASYYTMHRVGVARRSRRHRVDAHRYLVSFNEPLLLASLRRNSLALHNRIRATFHDIIAKVLGSKRNSKHLVRVAISHPSLDSDVWLAFMQAQKLDADMLLDRIAHVAQSKKEFRVDQNFVIEFTIIELKQVRGKAKNILDAVTVARRSSHVVTINKKTNDEMCMARSIVVGKINADCEYNPTQKAPQYWTTIRNHSRPMQAQQATDLMNEAGLAISDCVMGDACIDKFEAALGYKYKIHVYDIQGTCLYPGGTLGTKNIWLLYHNSHFDTVTNYSFIQKIIDRSGKQYKTIKVFPLKRVKKQHGGKKQERDPKKTRWCRFCRKRLGFPHKCYMQPDVGDDDILNRDTRYFIYDFETYLDRVTNEHKPETPESGEPRRGLLEGGGHFSGAALGLSKQQQRDGRRHISRRHSRRD